VDEVCGEGVILDNKDRRTEGQKIKDRRTTMKSKKNSIFLGIVLT
jgi:hypothetical protein